MCWPRDSNLQDADSPHQLTRHPLESCSSDAAHRPCGPAHEPRRSRPSQIAAHPERKALQRTGRVLELPATETNSRVCSSCYKTGYVKDAWCDFSTRAGHRGPAAPHARQTSSIRFEELNGPVRREPERIGRNSRLEYNKLLIDHPELAERLDDLPLKLFTGKQSPRADTKAVFLCYRIPRPDTSCDR